MFVTIDWLETLIIVLSPDKFLIELEVFKFRLGDRSLFESILMF